MPLYEETDWFNHRRNNSFKVLQVRWMSLQRCYYFLDPIGIFCGNDASLIYVELGTAERNGMELDDSFIWLYENGVE